MSKAAKFELHVNEHFTGADTLAERSCSTGAMPRKTLGTCEGFFGMSETNLNRIVGKLEGAAEALEKNSEKQAKALTDLNTKIDNTQNSINEKLEEISVGFDTRLKAIENMVAGARWIKWLLKVIIWPFAAFVFYHADAILTICKSFIYNYKSSFIFFSSFLTIIFVFLSPMVL